MTPAATMVGIEQVCSLELPGELTVPAVLELLHALVPSRRNAFFWVDVQGRVLNCYGEGGLAERIGISLREFTSHVDALIERESQYHQVLSARVGTPFSGKIGVLVLYRGKTDAPFGKHERRRIASVLPHLAGSLKRYPMKVDSPFRESGETGVIVVDQRGARQFMCRLGRRLLYLATFSSINRNTLRTQGTFPGLARLCRNFMRACKPPQLPPTLLHENPWGRFVFRAFLMEPVRLSAGRLISVTVAREEPLVLQVAKRLHATALSVTQRRVCLLLLKGATHMQIAARMQVSPHTTKDHVRKIYRKLNVRGREELAHKLTV